MLGQDVNYNPSEMAPDNMNVPVPNVPYVTPAQVPSSGTALYPQPNSKSIPKLFHPLKICGTGVELQNRTILSPLGKYSTKDGFLQPWHMAYPGGIFTRGPRLSFIEATAVLPEGRTTPQDVGIWFHKHIVPFT